MGGNALTERPRGDWPPPEVTRWQCDRCLAVWSVEGLAEMRCRYCGHKEDE